METPKSQQGAVGQVVGRNPCRSSLRGHCCWPRPATPDRADGFRRTPRRRSTRPFDRVRPAFGYCQWGGGTNCVVDGDTFWIGGEKVRIAGIDAPETHPSRCEDEARLGNAATEQAARAAQQRRGDDDQHRPRPRRLRAAAAQRGGQWRGCRRGDGQRRRRAGICGRAEDLVLAPDVKCSGVNELNLQGKLFVAHGRP